MGRVRTIATAAGAALLICLVTFATWLVERGDGFVSTALSTNAIAGLMAVAAWSGVLFRRNGGRSDVQPESWKDWVAIFFGAGLLSALFLFFDCGHQLPLVLGGVACDGHPGISVVFTVGALGAAAIALPSALRVWLLVSLSPRAALTKLPAQTPARCPAQDTTW